LTVEEIFRSFEEFTKTGTQTQVLVAFDRGEDLAFQRFTLEESVSEEFKLDALKSFVDGENFRFTKYEAGYKPDDDEICYIPLTESADVKNVVDGVFEASKNFNSIELFNGSEEVINELRFYVVIIDGTPSRLEALLFRTFTPKNELAKSGWKAYVQGKDFFNRLQKKIFLFDERSDCLVWNGYAFISSIPDFQRIFRYFEALQAKATETIKMVTPRLPILNLSDFTGACMNNPIMLSKLTQISKKDYLAYVTMNDIKQTIKDFGLPCEVRNDGGVEKLVFEPSPSRRWIILKLLDDDYLGSTMTKRKYASTSKIQI